MHLFRSQQVNLIHSQDDRRAIFDLQNGFGHQGIFGVRWLSPVDQPDDDVGIGDGSEGGVDHILAEFVVGFVNAGGIDEDQLDLVGG